jgi:hypothetical protein
MGSEKKEGVDNSYVLYMIQNMQRIKVRILLRFANRFA